MKRLILFIAAFCMICTGCTNNESYDTPEQGGNLGEVFIDETETGEGFGEDIIDVPEPRAITCHMCHGDGVCYHCDGDVYRNGRRCSVCNGTGECYACAGTGVLEVIEMDGQDYTLCTACQGTGVCEICDGEGKIVHQYSTLGRSERTCSMCHGNGKCISCKGSGLRKLSGF